MAKVRAAVLAAGMSVRMGGVTPKTLTPVGEHKPFLHYILAGLHRAGIEDLLVVTGFKSSMVEAFVAEEWKGEAALVFNARYASWGNFHSARMAIDQSPQSELLLVNSDIVIHPDVFVRVVDAPGDLVLAVQQRADFDSEEMRVQLETDRVISIGKDLPLEQSHGEFAGVSLLRPGAARAYAETATDLEWRAETTLYYEDVYSMLLGRLDARAVSVSEDHYAEVDNPDEISAAGEVLARHHNEWPEAVTSGTEA
ncbi:MAG: NTP transferase domain-containing protein [Actinobacteria bacterium]|nr:NTP transferase domain-containing protein [Actinomycetota bacterium]